MLNMLEFGERLRQARQKANLNATQAAKLANISQSVISRYESGEVIPAVDRVVDLANLYGCSLDWLCGRGDSDE